jgi:hypothetical protein
VNGFGFFAAQAVLVCFCFLLLRWHPRFVSVLHASPLCGAAPTFLCRRKEKVGKRKRLTPPILVFA